MTNYLQMMIMDLKELVPYAQNNVLDNNKKYISVKLNNGSVIKLYKNKIMIDDKIYKSLDNIDRKTIEMLNNEMNLLKKQGMFKLIESIKMGEE